MRTYYFSAFRNAVLLFHPVTTELDSMLYCVQNLVEAIEKSSFNYVVVFPNNDIGSNYIIQAYEKMKDKPKYRIFPSVRFEAFLVLLKHAKFLVGNSSAGIRETPYYGVPSVNVGTRQFNRGNSNTVINTGYKADEILEGIYKALSLKPEKSSAFGKGNSDKLFFELISKPKFWDSPKQKYFKDAN